MKQFKILFLISVLLLLTIGKIYSQTTNQWGNPDLGAKLSISLSNEVVTSGSTIFLHCLSKNFSTNYVCFIQTDPKGMYEVFVENTSGKSFKINGLENGDDTSDRGRGIAFGESYECVVPIPLDRKIKPGNYKIVAKQKIYIFKKPDRKEIQRGEVVSNSLDVQIK
jgi:hypothetical protein